MGFGFTCENHYWDSGVSRMIDTLFGGYKLLSDIDKKCKRKDSLS